jgi:DNA/RNA-binding domain of Phe-tRNA-synthetase-like protein
MSVFQYSPEIIKAFPEVAGGIIVAKGMKNGPSPDKLKAAFTAEQQTVIARIGETPLSELPSLAAWRRAFSKFGVKPTQYRSAAEALLRRLTKQGDIPSINTLVDIGNLVSIRYALPVAVVDMRGFQDGITVHFADGSEQFMELDTNEIEHPEAGEVVFTDARKIVIARRWCWRQSAESAAREDTTNALITFETQHTGGKDDVANAGEDLLALLREYAGGDYSMTILTASRPAV